MGHVRHMCREIMLYFIPGINPSILKRSIKCFIRRGGCPSNIISSNGEKIISQETGEFINNIGIY